jgi:phage head maturation protease
VENELPRVGDIYRAVFPSLEVIERDAEEAPILNMRFALFNRWTEIDSPFEGHFMERVAPGAFSKSIKENLANVRAILSHGKDPSMGNTVLGKIESIEEGSDGADSRVSLFRSLPGLLLDGLRAGVYGASFRGDPIKNDFNYRPKRSEHNPQAIPEVTRQEIRLRDIGPTPFAAYAETTAMVRCDTDEVVLRNLLDQTELVRSLLQQGAATLDQEEPEQEKAETKIPIAVDGEQVATVIARATTPLEDEPPHSAEEVHEQEEEAPSWQLRR